MPDALVLAVARFGFLILLWVFVFAVVVSFLYLIANGALDWGPSRAPAARTEAEPRTTRSTIQRVRRGRPSLGDSADHELVDSAAPRG